MRANAAIRQTHPRGPRGRSESACRRIAVSACGHANRNHEWTRMDANAGLSIRVPSCRVAVMWRYLHVIGGSNNLRESPEPAVFISEFRFGYQSGFFIRLAAGGEFQWRQGYVPPVTVYPSALKSAAKSFSICAAASNGIGLRYS